jgi:hypothetical protein
MKAAKRMPRTCRAATTRSNGDQLLISAVNGASVVTKAEYRSAAASEGWSVGKASAYLAAIRTGSSEALPIVFETSIEPALEPMKLFKGIGKGSHDVGSRFAVQTISFD